MDILIKKLINCGCTEETSSSLEKCLRLSNVAAIIISIAMIPFVLTYGFNQLYVVFSTVTFLLFFNLLIPLFNHLGHHKFARVTFLMVNFSIGFINSTFLGNDALVYLYLILSLPVSVMIFRPKENALLFLCLGWLLILVILDIVFEVTPFYTYELSDNLLQQIRLWVVFNCISCLLLFSLFIRKESAVARRNYEQLTINSQILKNNLDAVFFCDTDQRITFANNAAEVLYGYSASEFEGKALNWLDSKNNNSTTTEQLALEQHNETDEVIQKRKDGSLFTALTTQFVVTDDKGQPIGVASTRKDISPHKKTEQALIEAKEKAEEAATAKANFLATMSHEIRTPLNGVIGTSYLLLEDNPKPEHVESLNILKFAAENLLTLVNDVLDISKIDAGRITLETVPFCLKELMKSIETSSRYQALEKGIEFHVTQDQHLENAYQGDPIRLTQILLNLINNAIKFTNHGKVSLSMSLIECNEQSVDIEFKVSDTGIGIQPEKLETIFEQFSQADHTITRHYGGSGLGLAITKGLLNAFGSEIKVQSQPETGTEFSFILNMQKLTNEDKLQLTQPALTPHTSLNNTNKADDEFTGLSVLVAEDNPVNVMVIQKLLTNWGMSLDIVHNGQDAIEKVQKKNYHLVLMDIQMPVLDGLQATQAIRKIMKHVTLPIIALTASSTEELLEQAYAVGMDDFLGKPFNPNHLKSKIRRWCL